LNEESSPERGIRVAVDTGGTFTDVIAVVDGVVVSAKVPSTPDDPARAVANGIARALESAGRQKAQLDLLVHGTTVATNALLERRGVEPLVVVNAGFEGVLRIARQNRRQLYALSPVLPEPLAADDRMVGIGGRLDHRGEEVESLDLLALTALCKNLPRPETPRSWAVCLLHSYANPAHERAVGDAILRLRPDDLVTLSVDVLPMMREYERMVTTVANAYVLPLMRAYLNRLLPLATRVEIMGSAGFRLPVAEAALLPVHTALSGPAGGVVGAGRAAERAGLGGIVAFDMGGTSTDVCTNAGMGARIGGEVGDTPLFVPMLDIHTIGAGGGSIVWLDDGGSLRVGPQSAGAVPGPACYGRGELPTITDAHVVLERIPADTLLGGSMPLHPARARAAFSDLAEACGATVEELARGAIRIASESMAQAIRTMTVARGIDPRTLALCAFGGAGALHLCDIAEILGMTTGFVPPHAGILSAVGILAGSPGTHVSQTVLGQPLSEVERRLDAVGAELRQQWGQGVRMQATVDMRFAGQSHELPVPWNADQTELTRTFKQRYLEQFGYLPDEVPEWVNLQVSASVPSTFSAPDVDNSSGTVTGPAALVSRDTTLWVADGWTATAAPGGGYLVHAAGGLQ
jgi:N-methylhydantoinase A